MEKDIYPLGQITIYTVIRISDKRDKRTAIHRLAGIPLAIAKEEFADFREANPQLVVHAEWVRVEREYL